MSVVVSTSPLTAKEILRSKSPQEVLQHMCAEEALLSLDDSIRTLQRHMHVLDVAMAQLKSKRRAILTTITDREDLEAEHECFI